MIKAPMYSQQVDIKSTTPNQLDRHDISIISHQDTETPKAMERTAQQLMTMGNQLVEGQLINEAANREYEEKLRARQREADDITITNLVTQKLEEYTKKNDEMWDPNKPEGHTERMMDAFRTEAKEKTEGFMGVSPDFGLAYGRKIAALAPHIHAMASSREIHGKIMKEEEQLAGTLAVATGMAYRDGNMETWEMNRNNMIQTINNATWGNSDHGVRWKQRINDEMSESLIRGMLYGGKVTEAKQLFDSGKLDKFMSANTRQQLGTAINSAEHQHNSGLKYDITETLTSNIRQMAETGQATKPINEADVLKQFGEGTLKKYNDDIAVAKKQFDNKTKIENMPIAEATEYVKSLKPTDASSMNFNDEMKLYEHAQNVYANIQARIKEDPAGYAFARVQDLKGKFKNTPYIEEIYKQTMTQQNEKLGGFDKLKNGIMQFELDGPKGVQNFKWEDLATSSYVYQKENGFWTGNITPKGVIQADVNFIKTLPPNQLVPFMEQKRQQWGKWFENYWKDLCTVGKLSTEYKMVMFAQGTENQNKIVNAIRMKEEDLRKAFPTETEYKDVRNMITAQLEPFKRAINAGSASGRVMADGIIGDMSDVLTKVAAMDLTSGVGGKSKKDVVKRLINDFVNDRFWFADKYVIPKQIENRLPTTGTKLPPTLVSKDSVNIIQNNLAFLKSPGGMTDRSFMPSSATNEFEANKLRSSYGRYAYWVSNEDFSGVYLQYDYPGNNSVQSYPVVDRNGKRYEFKWGELMQLKTPAQPNTGVDYDARQRILGRPDKNSTKPADVYAPPLRK